MGRQILGTWAVSLEWMDGAEIPSRPSSGFFFWKLRHQGFGIYYLRYASSLRPRVGTRSFLFSERRGEDDPFFVLVLFEMERVPVCRRR
jgi:hypothetical protein